jgi:F0F1-type ATP synthase assembly protein I
MLQLAVRAIISGVLVAVAAYTAKRAPEIGALIASLPLVAVLAMIWLWRDKPDANAIAAFSSATFWYVLPSLPMFLAIPVMLRQGWPFWLSLTLGCILTMMLYWLMTLIAPKLDINL